MMPRDDLRFGGTTYVLAKPGESYIAYAPALAGSLGLKGMTAGTYDLRWLDAATGTMVSQTGVIVGQGEETWSSPRRSALSWLCTYGDRALPRRPW